MSYGTGPVKIALLIALAILLSFVINRTEGGRLSGGNLVFAEEEWRHEFEVVCSGTQDAMSLSTDELKSLIDRCDKLKSVIDKLPESPRKVYLKRLQLCRDLYSFVLESKKETGDRL